MTSCISNPSRARAICNSNVLVAHKVQKEIRCRREQRLLLRIVGDERCLVERNFSPALYLAIRSFSGVIVKAAHEIKWHLQGSRDFILELLRLDIACQCTLRTHQYSIVAAEFHCSPLLSNFQRQSFRTCVKNFARVLLQLVV